MQKYPQKHPQKHLLTSLKWILLGPLTLLFTGQASAVPANDLPPFNWKPRSWGLTLQSEYFTTEGNYDEVRGSFTRLPGGSEMKVFQNRFKGRVGLSESVSIFGGAGYNHARTIETILEKSNASVSDVFLGADYILNRRGLLLIPEIQGGYPFDSVDETQVVPFTNDSVAYIKAGMFAFKPYKYIRFGGYAGVHVFVEGLASRMVYEAHIELPIKKLLVGGGINGYEAINSDEMSLAQRASITNRASAGSQRFLAYEPALLEARGWIGYQPHRSLQVRLGYGKTLNGLRTAEGQSILFSLAYLASTTVPKPRLGPQIRNDGFELELEETDRTLFEEEKPRSEPPRTRAPRKSKSEDLDQTEKLLEWPR